MASALSNRQNCACARKHYKHNEDGRTAPGVCGNGSVPLSHSGNVVTRIGIHTHTHTCTFNSGHIGTRAPNVNKMGCPFYFHTSRRKYLFQSRKKEIIILHSTNAHVRCTIQQNGSQSESTIEISGCVTVFEDLNNFVDMNGSIYR